MTTLACPFIAQAGLSDCRKGATTSYTFATPRMRDLCASRDACGSSSALFAVEPLSGSSPNR
jgi:hypothetical protein